MELLGFLAGIAAAAIPVWYLSRRLRGGASMRWPMLVSLSCCRGFLWDQLLFRCYQAGAGSVSAWQDTAGAVNGVTGVVLAAVWALNGLALGLDREERQ